MEAKRSILIVWILFVVSIMLLASSLFAASSKPEKWDFARKLQDTGHSGAPDMCWGDRYIHLAYVDYPASSRDGYVTHLRSGDGGSGWSAPKRLSDLEVIGFSDNYRVRIACWGDEVHVAWISRKYLEFDGGFTLTASVMHRTSADNGASWSDAARLNTGFPTEIIGFDVLVSDALVLAAWNEYYFVEQDWGHHAVSEDRGLTWTEAEALHPNPMGFVHVDIDGDTVYAVANTIMVNGTYDFGNCTLLIGEDGGRTWRNFSLADYFGIEKLFPHGIAVDQRRLLITSSEGLLLSKDGGLNWTLDADFPDWALTSEGSSIVSWNYNWSWINASTDRGESWASAPVPQVDGMRVMARESSSMNVSVLLVSEYDDCEIHMLYSEDLGQTWKGPVRVTEHYDPYLLVLFATGVAIFILNWVLTVLFWKRLK